MSKFTALFLCLAFVAVFGAALAIPDGMADDTPHNDRNTIAETDAIEKQPTDEASEQSIPKSRPQIPSDLATRLDWLETPEKVSDKPFSLGNGSERSLRDYRGRLLIVNLWAMWCPPCIEELPYLDALQRHLDEGYARVLLLSADDKKIDETSKFLDKHQVFFAGRLYDLDGHMFDLPQHRGLPSTFIIAPDGTVIAMAEGDLKWDSQTSKAFFDQLVAYYFPDMPSRKNAVKW